MFCAWSLVSPRKQKVYNENVIITKGSKVQSWNPLNGVIAQVVLAFLYFSSLKKRFVKFAFLSQLDYTLFHLEL